MTSALLVRAVGGVMGFSGSLRLSGTSVSMGPGRFLDKDRPEPHAAISSEVRGGELEAPCSRGERMDEVRSDQTRELAEGVLRELGWVALAGSIAFNAVVIQE